MLKGLPSWDKLTSSGQFIPSFSVARRSMLVDGAEIPVGAVVAPDTFANRLRLRQFYEQRLLIPVVGPATPAVPRSVTKPVLDTFVSFDAPAIPVVEVADEAKSYTPSKFRRQKGVKR